VHPQAPAPAASAVPVPPETPPATHSIGAPTPSSAAAAASSTSQETPPPGAPAASSSAEEALPQEANLESSESNTAQLAHPEMRSVAGVPTSGKPSPDSNFRFAVGAGGPASAAPAPTPAWGAVAGPAPAQGSGRIGITSASALDPVSPPGSAAALPPAAPAPVAAAAATVNPLAAVPAPTSLKQTSSATPVPPQQGQGGAARSFQSHSSGESEASPPAAPVPDRAAAPLPPPSSAAAHTHTQQVERVSARASLLVKPPAGGRTQAPEGGAAATAPQSLRSTEEESPAPPPSSAAAPAPTPAAGPAPAPGSGQVGITSASGLAPVSPPATGSQLRAETSAKQDLKKPTRMPPPRPVRQENSSGAGPLGAQQSATGDQAEEDLEITTQRFQSRLRGIAEANGFSVDKVTPPAVARLKIDPLREPQASSAPASPPGSPKPKDLKPSEVKRPTAPAPGQQQKTVAESIPTQPLTTALEPKSKEELAELAAEEALATLAKEIAEAVLAEEPLPTTTSTSPRLGVGLAGTTSLAESLVQERSTRKGGLFNKNELQENTSDEIANPTKLQTTAQTRQTPRPITSPPNDTEIVVAGTGKDPLTQVTAPSLLPSSDQEHLQTPGTLQPPSSATVSPEAMGTAGLISAAQSPKPPSGADLPPSALARSAAEQLEPHDEESDSPDILQQIEYEIRTALQTIIPTISSEEIALHRTSLTSSSSTQGTTPDKSNISLLLRIIEILQPDSTLVDKELLTPAIYAIEEGDIITYLASLPFANLQDPPTKPSNIQKLQAIKESLIELIPATDEDLEVLQGGHPGSHETSIQQLEAKAELQSRAEIDRTQQTSPLVQPALSTSNAATAAPAPLRGNEQKISAFLQEIQDLGRDSSPSQLESVIKKSLAQLNQSSPSAYNAVSLLITEGLRGTRRTGAPTFKDSMAILFTLTIEQIQGAIDRLQAALLNKAARNGASKERSPVVPTQTTKPVAAASATPLQPSPLGAEKLDEEIPAELEAHPDILNDSDRAELAQYEAKLTKETAELERTTDELIAKIQRETQIAPAPEAEVTEQDLDHLGEMPQTPLTDEDQALLADLPTDEGNLQQDQSAAKPPVPPQNPIPSTTSLETSLPPPSPATAPRPPAEGSVIGTTASAAPRKAPPAPLAGQAPEAQALTEPAKPSVPKGEQSRVIKILAQPINLDAVLRQIGTTHLDLTQLSAVIPTLTSLKAPAKRQALENLQLLIVDRNAKAGLTTAHIDALSSEELKKINSVRLPRSDKELALLIQLLYPKLPSVPDRTYQNQYTQILGKATQFLRAHNSADLTRYLHTLPTLATQTLTPIEQYKALGSITAMLIKRGVL